MKKLNKLGLILGITTVSAFSLGGCSDDTTTPGGVAGSGTAGSGTAGSGTAGSGTAGSGTAGSGTSGSGGSGTAGSGGSGTSGSGGSTAGSGGSTAGGGGMAGGGGSAGGGGMAGGGGSGGGGGVSAACTKLCEGADSIGTVCMSENNVAASLKDPAMCKTRCAKETDMMKVGCWQMHTTNAKGEDDAGEKTMHCGHAAGMTPCQAWPQ